MVRSRCTVAVGERSPVASGDGERAAEREGAASLRVGAAAPSVGNPALGETVPRPGGAARSWASPDSASVVIRTAAAATAAPAAASTADNARGRRGGRSKGPADGSPSDARNVREAGPGRRSARGSRGGPEAEPESESAEAGGAEEAGGADAGAAVSDGPDEGNGPVTESPAGEGVSAGEGASARCTAASTPGKSSSRSPPLREGQPLPSSYGAPPGPSRTRRRPSCCPRPRPRPHLRPAVTRTAECAVAQSPPRRPPHTGRWGGRRRVRGRSSAGMSVPSRAVPSLEASNRQRLSRGRTRSRRHSNTSVRQAPGVP